MDWENPASIEKAKNAHPREAENPTIVAQSFRSQV
jgi:hypothetical protein